MNNPNPHPPKPERAMAAEAQATRPPVSGPEMVPLDALSAGQALMLLSENPVGFIRRIVAEQARTHLADLKEQAELRGALNIFRKANPEFQRFEPFILQEVATMIESDPDGAIDPWDKLLEKATAVFKRKFEDTLKSEVSRQGVKPVGDEPRPPFMEGAANRVAEAVPPAYSREQIARMTLDEYLKNEAAIDAALQGKRIR